jgi:hypothetical protein
LVTQSETLVEASFLGLNVGSKKRSNFCMMKLTLQNGITVYLFSPKDQCAGKRFDKQTVVAVMKQNIMTVWRHGNMHSRP